MKPIIYQGKEYKDRLTVVTKIRLNLWQRFKNLWYPETVVETEHYFSVEVPPHTNAPVKLTGYSYWDLFKIRWKIGKFRDLSFVALPPTPPPIAERLLTEPFGCNHLLGEPRCGRQCEWCKQFFQPIPGGTK